MKILVIGSGGREHAMAWKLAESPLVEKIYCAPGNGGTELEDKCENVNLLDIDKLIAFAKNKKVDITIVGPEAPLVEGIVDIFRSEGLKIFGPDKCGARLEGSKAYAKEFMRKFGVKTAEYAIFDNADEALIYLQEAVYPLVIKADGLAAGKGVSICFDYKEARENINSFMVEDIFHGAGKQIVIEEYLEGVEASILAITDGKTMIPLLSAKDHKTIYENNKGPNTGGMGAVAPNPYCNEDVWKSFIQEIMEPTLKGIIAERINYIGIVFFGIMITDKGVYLLEYNVRMGDPETQTILPLMKSDFAELILSALDRSLSDYNIHWENKYSCCVVAASKGYPGNYEKGYSIEGLNNLASKAFIAGAELKNNSLLTSGGRVLCVTSTGNTLEEARLAAYGEIGKINFDGMYYRKDIGQ